jgi:Flp pilus assembly pilin Flp
MKALIKNFSKNRRGLTSVEYGLIAAGIALVVAVSVKELGPDIAGALCKANGQVLVSTDSSTFDCQPPSRVPFA